MVDSARCDGHSVSELRDHAKVGPGRPGGITLPVLAAGCALLLYAPFRSQRFDPNGILDALAVDAGDGELWNPNHLLYRPFGAALEGAARLLGYGGRSIGPLQLVSAVGGAITVGYALLVCWRLSRDRWAACLAAALLATAWAQWTFSTDAGYITLASAAAAATLAWALSADTSVRSACTGGALYALAVLCWQGNVFLAPVLIARLWLWRAERRLLATAVLLSTSGTLVLALYALAARWSGHGAGLGGAVEWATHYGGGGSVALPMWGRWSFEHVGGAGNAWLSSFLPVWEGLGLRALTHGNVQGDKVLGQLALVAALAIIAASFRQGREARRRGILPSMELAWLAAGVGAYLPFIVWWDPFSPKWFVIVNLFVVAAAAIIWSGAGPTLRALLGLAIGTIAVANFAATIRPAHSGPSPHDALARCVGAQVERNDLVLVTDWGWFDYARYWYEIDYQVLYLVDARPPAEKLALITERLARVRENGARGYVMEVDRALPERVAWMQELTQLRSEDLDRFAPRHAFTCAGVSFAELTRSGAER